MPHGAAAAAGAPRRHRLTRVRWHTDGVPVLLLGLLLPLVLLGLLLAMERVERGLREGEDGSGTPQ